MNDQSYNYNVALSQGKRALPFRRQRETRKRHFYFSAAFRYLAPTSSNATGKYKKISGEEISQRSETPNIRRTRGPARASSIAPRKIVRRALACIYTSHKSRVMEHPDPPTRCANVTTNHLISDQVPIITFLVLPARNDAVSTLHNRVRSAVDSRSFLEKKIFTFASISVK